MDRPDIDLSAATRRATIQRGLGWLAASTTAAWLPTHAAAESKLALVIGNGAYKIGQLRKPVEDARAVASRLQELGFEVERCENATLRTMIEALAEFSRKAPTRSVRVMYYAGHGLQWRGRNFLVPVDSEIRSEEEVASRCAEVSELVDRLTAIRQGTNIVILDACQANPFAGGVFVTPEGRLFRIRDPKAPTPDGWRRMDMPPGLARQDAPAGTLIAYATAPGQVAFEGPAGSHSPYAKHLLANIGTPGMPIEQVFKRVRNAVLQDTDRRQTPWESSSLINDFCFRPNDQGRCGS